MYVCMYVCMYVYFISLFIYLSIVTLNGGLGSKLQALRSASRAHKDVR